jgi:hypothetical protein
VGKGGYDSGAKLTKFFRKKRGKKREIELKRVE